MTHGTGDLGGETDPTQRNPGIGGPSDAAPDPATADPASAGAVNADAANTGAVNADLASTGAANAEPASTGAANAGPASTAAPNSDSESSAESSTGPGTAEGTGTAPLNTAEPRVSETGAASDGSQSRGPFDDAARFFPWALQPRSGEPDDVNHANRNLAAADTDHAANGAEADLAADDATAVTAAGAESLGATAHAATPGHTGRRSSPAGDTDAIFKLPPRGVDPSIQNVTWTVRNESPQSGPAAIATGGDTGQPGADPAEADNADHDNRDAVGAESADGGVPSGIVVSSTQPISVAIPTPDDSERSGPRSVDGDVQNAQTEEHGPGEPVAAFGVGARRRHAQDDASPDTDAPELDTDPINDSAVFGEALVPGVGPVAAQRARGEDPPSLLPTDDADGAPSADASNRQSPRRSREPVSERVVGVADQTNVTPVSTDRSAGNTGSTGNTGSSGSTGGQPIVRTVVLGAALVLLFVIGLFVPRIFVGSPEASGPADTPTAPANDAASSGIVQWNELSGGECITDFTTAWQSEFAVVDCEQPHDAQLVRLAAVSDVANAPFPGQEQLADDVAGRCAAPDILAEDADTPVSELQAQGAYPASETEWDAAESPQFGCFVTRIDGGELTGSLAAADASQ